ncbi:hypothetical protein E8F11_17500 [Pseudomonas sp. BN417]|uniref:DUF6484 domain-containing protein n=1 Tax=Pseudomonas sp. BN417 TaxID=2567890 RepID=UPI0024577300|nr:DUF6484 domain-containing protein [Pseudomonas sp. BN417]MDH4556941.1 hypothetical protein [Pseudomonas sp. BN417]
MSEPKQRPLGEQLANDMGDKTPLQQGASGQGRLLDAMLRRQAEVSARNTRVDGVLIGWLADIDDNGTPLVMVPDLLPEPRPAVSLCPLSEDQVGTQCAVMFGAGNRDNPILMGMLHHNVLTLTHSGGAQVQDDGESLRIEHAKEIALHCGKASLRLTRDGRIELRGTTLISHATGLNRVRGASIKLN